MADSRQAKLGLELLKATGQSTGQPTGDSLTAQQQRAIDQVCIVFEQRWSADQSSIERTLRQHPDLCQTNLLESLLAVELELRWQSGQAPDLLAYRDRFPQNQEAVIRVYKHAQHEIERENNDSPNRSTLNNFDTAEVESTGPISLPEIPGYQVISELGRGGMGVVYRARQLTLKRQVALKVIARGQQATAAQRARFQREGEMVATFAHPNIAHVYDAGESSGLSYFASELIEGGTLADIKTPIATTQAMLLVATVADALAVAHANGIVHCDLKPANILLASSSDGMVVGNQKVIPKIADFGLASSLHEDSSKTSYFCGTPDFMSPEQIDRGAKITPATDLHALGLIFYQLLTGINPFRQETVEATLDRVRQHMPTAPSTYNPRIPVAADHVCLACLNKDATKRLNSATELANTLRQIIHYDASKNFRNRRLALVAIAAVTGIPLSVLGVKKWSTSPGDTATPSDSTPTRSSKAIPPGHVNSLGQSIAKIIFDSSDAWLAARVDGTDIFLTTQGEVKQHQERISKIRLPRRFQLRKQHRNELAMWKSLQVFEAAHTPFSDRDAAIFDQLPALQLIDLFGSRVTGHAMESMLGLKHLSSLGIGQTMVTTSDIARLGHLPIKFLNVTGNSFNESNATGNLAKLKQLETMQVVRCSIEHLRNVIKLKQIFELRLYPGLFSPEAIAMLEQMENLSSLDTTIETSISGSLDFRPLKNLQRLKLWFSQAHHKKLPLHLPDQLRTLEIIGDVGSNDTRWAKQNPTVEVFHHGQRVDAG